MKHKNILKKITNNVLCVALKQVNIIYLFFLSSVRMQICRET